jgi:hypothetical protein
MNTLDERGNSLNSDFVTEAQWWEHPDFEKQEVLEAAELVAFDVLEQALRSRFGMTERSVAASQFREEIE